MKSSKQNLMLDVCTDMEYLVCLFSPSLELSTRWVSAFSHRLSASLIFEYFAFAESGVAERASFQGSMNATLYVNLSVSFLLCKL